MTDFSLNEKTFQIYIWLNYSLVIKGKYRNSHIKKN